ncbi:uncharacterized protein LOC108941542 [Scleropages formosus]|uniref:uncharacterized protein LOC108941542 n=1 Tax=Scleropages formosus TaxID=113540 RepID=UPI0010FAC2A1|nr:uncharacterized protein LOC108941542 [Scleropages formosus]
MAAGGSDQYELDVHLSVGFLRKQLGGTIEEAVRTAVETVLCETVRLLGERLGHLQGAREHEGLAGVAGLAGLPGLPGQSLKLWFEAAGEDWKAEPGGDDSSRDQGSAGKAASTRSTSRPNCGAQKPHGHGDVPEPPRDEHADFGVFPDPFDMASAGPREDFAEGQDMGLPEDWELMNKVYKVEHSEALSFIDEGGTAHYAEDYMMHDRDLRIITVPLEEELSEMDTAGSKDHPTQFRQADIKKELPEAQTSGVLAEAAVLPSRGEPQGEDNKGCDAPTEFGPQNHLEQLRLWLERLCPEVVREYERDGCLCELSRRKLIKFAVSFIMDQFGFYPTSAQKTMLAEHIVELFPSLRLCVPSAGINGVEHLYDPVSRTGYIETRLRNFRRTLEADKKKYVLKRRRAELGLPGAPVGQGQSSSEETRKWVALMKRTKPLSKNLPTIRTAMERTFVARRKWMNSARPCLSAVLAKYPRFLDVPSTIDLEFEKMYPGKGDAFMSKWSSSVLPRVRQIAEWEKHPEITALLQQASSQQEDSCTLTMLKVLMLLLPPANTGRGSLPTKFSIKHAIRYLVDLVPMDTNVSTLFCDLSTAEPPSTLPRPYILSVGPLDSPGRKLYILAPVERVVMALPEGGLSAAVDKLFKFLRIFNLDYPVQLAPLYSFLEHLYGLEKPHSALGSKKSKVLELVSGLQALS